ncbi:MAG: MmcQ/YjbR family DNA-binding protein [Pseudomonadota bacterium]|nr:MmcQ/YjbR family DNA-binding protein [Pseudomonadota bacterium]
MINLDEFNEFCKSLPATTYVVQWKGSHVWKVADKIFTIGRWGNRKHSGITFKVSKITFECLKNVRGFRPAPYLASRGMQWLQYYGEKELSSNDLKAYLSISHKIVSLGLTKKKQKELGLIGK